MLRPRTYLVWFVLRAFMGPGGDAGPAKATLQQVRIYPWASARTPPAMRYLDASGKPYDTIHPIDGRYFAHLAAMVEYEFGLPPAPETNVPTKGSDDPHGIVRHLDPSYKQADKFFRSGVIEAFCNGG